MGLVRVGLVGLGLELVCGWWWLVMLIVVVGILFVDFNFSTRLLDVLLAC